MARFISTYNTLKLTMKVPYTEYLGINNRKIHAGKIIEFRQGMYETDDEAEIDFIRKHRWYGSKIVEVKPEDLRRGTAQVNKGIVSIPCGFEGCDYVAEGETEGEASRRLTGHRNRMGHWADDLPEVEADDGEE